ncbi:MAG TPA: hypothetical protein VGE12_11325 [Noviherbaspirillum sp.]
MPQFRVLHFFMAPLTQECEFASARVLGALAYAAFFSPWRWFFLLLVTIDSVDAASSARKCMAGGLRAHRGRVLRGVPASFSKTGRAASADALWEGGLRASFLRTTSLIAVVPIRKVIANMHLKNCRVV